MRLTDKQLGDELRRIRQALPGQPSQERFISKYGRSLGIPDNTSLSRFEKADRRPSVRVLRAYVETFPVEAASIRLHLQSDAPVVEFDRRTVTIRQLPDESFEVHEEAESLVRLDRYLFAYCEGREISTELRRRVPQLFGLQTVAPGEGNLADRIAGMHSGGPLRYYEPSRPGHVGRSVEFHPTRLSDSEITELGTGLTSELLSKCVVFGCDLSTTEGLKRFLTDTKQYRRATLRDFYWSAFHPHYNLEHKIRFQSHNTATVDSFNVYTFFPAIEVIRTPLNSNEVALTLTADTPSHPGNGWVVTWLNGHHP